MLRWANMSCGPLDVNERWQETPTQRSLVACQLTDNMLHIWPKIYFQYGGRRTFWMFRISNFNHKPPSGLTLNFRKSQDLCYEKSQDWTLIPSKKHRDNNNPPENRARLPFFFSVCLSLFKGLTLFWFKKPLIYLTANRTCSLPSFFYQFLPARRYASAGYRDRNVSVRPSVCPSVCPSVRHAPVLCQNE